jgi:hypothetical protein
MRQFLLVLFQSLFPTVWQVQSDEGCGADPNGKPRCSP